MIIESVMCLLTELSILMKDKQIEKIIEQEKAGAAERTRASLLTRTLIGQDHPFGGFNPQSRGQTVSRYVNTHVPFFGTVSRQIQFPL